ncbi:MAG: dihydrolipoyl dehydrogenase family protein [Candidatus Woesearchaeota archaeon]
MKNYDLIVIGTGGGSKVARAGYMLGKKVALIEKDNVGGTCLNRGCIPSKMLIYPSHIKKQIDNAKSLDIVTQKSNVNFNKLIKRINSYSNTVSRKIESSYKKRDNLDFYKGTAEFISNKILKINNDIITSDKIVIATGSRPLIPNIKGLSEVPYITSTQALTAKKLPKKMIIIGAGYIACELGNAYGLFGTKVHFFVRSCLLRNEDKDIRSIFHNTFSQNHKIHLGEIIESVSHRNNLFSVNYLDIKGKRKTIKADSLLVCTGVTPNSDNLELKNTQIKTKNKYIKVNNYLETSVKGVYAIGDIIGNYLFRHSVNFESEYLIDKLFFNYKKPIKYPPMPHAVFTDPEIASVGLTEDELIKKKVKYIAGKSNYNDSAMGQARKSNVGMVKLLFNKSEVLIGAHIIGDDAATMLHQLIFAISNKAKLDDLYSMIYIHPALPEIVRDAVRDAKKQFDKKSSFFF